MSIWSGHLSVRWPQDLEDLATAGWLAETLFAALELGIFEALADRDAPVDEAHVCGRTAHVDQRSLGKALLQILGQ